MALPKSIGIRLFDDSFVPVLTEGEIKNKKVILTTVKDNQKKAIIKLYEGNSDKCADNEFLGKLVIPINRKTTKGEPGLEVHLRLDDDGMLYAKAWDVESGEQTNIKIEHNETPRIFPETLSDVEIDDLDADSDTKKIDDIGDFDDNNAADANDNNFSFGDEYSEDDNQDFSDNSYNDDYNDNYDDNADSNYANTTYNTEYKEEKNNNTLKGILIGIIIFLLLVLIALGIICGVKACSNTEKKPKPAKPPKTIQTTTTTYEDYLEEETTTTVTTTTTIYVAPKPETTGVKTLSGKKHFIRRGDNLWNICKRYYGDPWYYPDLAKYNNLRSPRFIIAGQNLIIPDKSELKRWDFSK